MITLQKNGVTKNVATGFSWKSFFFGCLYPTARGDYKGLFIQWILAILTFGLSWFVVPFTYNKAYIKRLLIDGYTPSDYRSKEYLIREINYQAEVWTGI
jgi:hypothetical protein